MENVSAGTVMTAILAIASAIVLLSNAAEKIVAAIKVAKAPNVRQDERLTALESWQRSVNDKLSNDHKRINSIEEGNRATQHALLALLDHGIDGNNIKQMQDAKVALQNHLINR